MIKKYPFRFMLTMVLFTLFGYLLSSVDAVPECSVEPYGYSLIVSFFTAIVFPCVLAFFAGRE